MNIITFKKGEYQHSWRTEEKPVININNATYTTGRTDWVKQLENSRLTIEAVGFSPDDKEIERNTTPIHLSSYITPYTRQPILDLNLFENFPNTFNRTYPNNCYWITTITLSELNLEETETLSISFMDKAYVRKRVNDWKSRIAALYNDISLWLQDDKRYIIKAGNPAIMMEDLMKKFEIPQQEIETRDIYLNGKIIVSIKPKGLWMLAANGRIDLISRKGSFVIADLAENFCPAQWNIYTADHKKRREFKSSILSEILAIVSE